tara:strand:+ start:359 stop:664 length:306 start_codon:yes stop_codon:yes gene_type:complete
MKNFILILIGCFTLSTVVYASFPVSDNGVKTELSISNDDINSPIAPPAELHFGGLLLGLLLGLIGVGLAYIFSDNPDFRRNAWYGFGIWLIIWLLLFMPVA